MKVFQKPTCNAIDETRGRTLCPEIVKWFAMHMFHLAWVPNFTEWCFIIIPNNTADNLIKLSETPKQYRSREAVISPAPKGLRAGLAVIRAPRAASRHSAEHTAASRIFRYYRCKNLLISSKCITQLWSHTLSDICTEFIPSHGYEMLFSTIMI